MTQFKISNFFIMIPKNEPVGLWAAMTCHQIPYLRQVQLGPNLVIDDRRSQIEIALCITSELLRYEMLKNCLTVSPSKLSCLNHFCNVGKPIYNHFSIMKQPMI